VVTTIWLIWTPYSSEGKSHSQPPAIPAAVPGEDRSFLPLYSRSPTWRKRTLPDMLGETCLNFLPLKSGSPTESEYARNDHCLTRLNFLPLKSGSPTMMFFGKFPVLLFLCLNFLPLKSGSPTPRCSRVSFRTGHMSQFPASQERKSHSTTYAGF
jgi:hypothetical protein